MQWHTIRGDTPHPGGHSLGEATKGNPMRLTLTIDRAAAQCLIDTLPGEIEACQDENAAKAAGLRQTLKEAQRVAREMDLAARATMLAETRKIAVYENPEEGDEAPLMVYSKIHGEFWRDSPFYDADWPAEIEEWVEDMMSET